MSGAVRSGCVVVEAMQTADKYLRVLIFALLMKQLDFELYTKHQWPHEPWEGFKLNRCSSGLLSQDGGGRPV
jgi:hypothetical protein